MSDTLTKAQFKQIVAYIEKNVGIQLSDEKHLMIQSRLAARLKALNMSTYEEYLHYVFSNTPDANEEIISMIDVITTNLTHFFRESSHFDYLTKTVLPDLSKAGIAIPEIWSAGCSSGQEPYTLSIVVSEFLRTRPGAFRDYKILATDISTRMLEKAANAVYTMDGIKSISMDVVKRHFLRSKDGTQVRVKPATRQKVSFQRLNFMENFSVNPKKDVIFCRNVLIYFDKPTQLQVISQLVQNLKIGGHLFLGHSETIFGMKLPVETVAPTVFRRIE